MGQFEQRFVAPFYLDVLHGNLVALATSASRQDEIVREMRVVAPEVTLDTAVYLWSRGWREALMASWWAAVWQWPETVDQVEPLLIPSRSSYEGQAHCLALTRVRSARARAVLMRYLDAYLPRPGLDYDQPWAMAALQLASADVSDPVPGQYLQAWLAVAERKAARGPGRTRGQAGPHEIPGRSGPAALNGCRYQQATPNRPNAIYGRSAHWTCGSCRLQQAGCRQV